MRTRRPGDAAFRRGTPAGEGWDESGRSAYRPFRPEPEDELVHPGGKADEGGAARVDNTPPGFDERPPPLFPPPVAPQPVAPPPVAPSAVTPPQAEPPPPAPVVPEQQRAPEPQPQPPEPAREQVWAAPEELYEDEEPYDYRYATGRGGRDRSAGGTSALAIGGFVLLGILAIGVGAFISGIFAGGVAEATPSPTPTVTASPTASPVPSLSSLPSASAAATANPSLPPFTFADGFTARTEPCLDEPQSDDGCNSSGASISGGSVWIWVGFRKGNNSDELGVKILDASGTEEGTGSLSLGSIGCGDSCNGWARFRFSGLDPGTYTIRVERGGVPAAEAGFTVTG